jgi:AraC-like DNA-binding protein
MWPDPPLIRGASEELVNYTIADLTAYHPPTMICAKLPCCGGVAEPIAQQKGTDVSELAATATAAGLAARLANAHLKRKGLDTAPLLKRCLLTARALEDHSRISAISQMKFLDLASEATGDEWICVTLAESFDLREMGLLYYAAASSHRLGDALKRLERYARVGNEALIINVEIGKTCRIRLSYAGVARHLDRQQTELFAVALLRMCRQFVGQRLTPLSVSFVHHRSGELRRIRSIFGAEIRFGKDADEIIFDKAVAELALIGHDPFLNKLMEHDCEAALAARTSVASSLRTKVENIIGPLLPHAEAQAITVAVRLGMSERTFARRLAAEGLSFGAILDDLRRDLAARYLTHGNLQIAEIAWRLGFRQPSALSRACRRWFGKSPLAHRRSLLARSAEGGAV